MEGRECSSTALKMSLFFVVYVLGLHGNLIAKVRDAFFKLTHYQDAREVRKRRLDPTCTSGRLTHRRQKTLLQNYYTD